MKGFHLSTGASTATPDGASEVSIDMTGGKKGQSRGFARIAKLVTSNKKELLEQVEETEPKKVDLEQKRGYVNLCR